MHSLSEKKVPKLGLKWARWLAGEKMYLSSVGIAQWYSTTSYASAAIH